MNISREAIADARARFPRAFAAHPFARVLRIVGILAALFCLYVLGRRTELLSAKFVAGLGQTWTIIQSMWPPRVDTAGPILNSPRAKPLRWRSPVPSSRR